MGMLLIFAVSLGWTVARMALFNLLHDEEDIWWNSVAGILVAFLSTCWTAMFHGLMYYHVLQREHQILLDSQHQVQEEYVKRVEAQTLARTHN